MQSLTALTSKNNYKHHKLIKVTGNMRIVSGYCLLFSLMSSAEYAGVGILKAGDVLSPSMFEAFDCFYLKTLTNCEIESIPESLEFEAEERFSTLKNILSFSMQLVKHKKVSERLEMFLNYCRNIQGFPTKELIFRIPQQEIADMLQSTRVTITKELTKMQEDKKIEIVHRRIRFLDV